MGQTIFLHYHHQVTYSFIDISVVKRVCDKERQHKVEGVTLKVSPYYRCELGEIFDSSLHCSPLPDPISVPPLAKAQILRAPHVAEVMQYYSLFN